MTGLIDQDKLQKSEKFSGKKILVIDDNEFVSEMISRVLLKYLNIEVTKARGGSQAVAAALTGRYDGAIIELALHGASSSRIIRTIKTMLPGFPILPMCAHPTDEMLISIKRHGITHVINKPFRILSLIEEITIMLGANQALSAQNRSLTVEE